MWNAHYNLDIKIVETQAEWTPLQRMFLALAADEYGPDEPDTPNIPSSPHLRH